MTDTAAAQLDTDDAGDSSPFGPTPSVPVEQEPDARPKRRTLRRLADVTAGGGKDKPPADDTPAVDRPRTTRGERAPRTRPASSGRREPLAGVLSMLYAGIGTALGHAGEPSLIPTARVLQFNAPVAGRAFDELIAGTVVDRLAQPLAKRGDKLQAAGNALLLPALIYAVTVRPELWSTLEPLAREIFYANLVEMAPVIKDRQKREREMTKVIKELADEGLIGMTDDGTMPDADSLFRSIFAPVEQPAPAPEPEPAPEP